MAQAPQTPEQQLTAMKQKLDTLEALFTAQQAVLTTRQGEKTGLKINKFSGTSKEDFESFMRQATLAHEGNRWTVRQTIISVLHSMQGDAARITSSMGHDPALYNNDLNDFFQALRLLFVTPAHVTQAKAEYASRVQRKDENIRIYHGLLQKLWANAFMAEREPWRATGDPPPDPHQPGDPPGHRDEDLMRKFISGLHSEAISVKIRDSITMGMPLRNYAELLKRALEFDANISQNTVDHKIVNFSQRLFHKAPGFDLAPQSRPEDPVPMEIGAMGMANQNPDKYCTHHKVNTHSTANCRVLKGQAKKQQPRGQQPSTKATGTTPNQKKPQNSGKPEGKACFGCGGKGHFKSECPTLKKRAVHAMGDSETEDEDLAQAQAQGWGEETHQGN